MERKAVFQREEEIAPVLWGENQAPMADGNVGQDEVLARSDEGVVLAEAHARFHHRPGRFDGVFIRADHLRAADEQVGV